LAIIGAWFGPHSVSVMNPTNSESASVEPGPPVPAGEPWPAQAEATAERPHARTRAAPR
jgi:hypothetical protein